MRFFFFNKQYNWTVNVLENMVWIPEMNRTVELR